jgi:hypothetical protein
MSFDRNFANLMMACELAEQVAEGCFFVAIETGKELLIVAIGNLCQLRNDAPSRTRQ